MPQNDIKVQLSDVTAWTADNMRLLGSQKPLAEWKFAPGAQFEPDVIKQSPFEKGLRYLTFNGSELGRENLLALAEFKSLKHLDLGKCQFAQSDFITLCERWAQGACPHLVQLWLGGTPIGDNEICALGQVKQLRRLDLSDTTVSDRGAKYLTALEKLEYLVLSNTRVSDAGVVSLAVLPHLDGVASYGIESHGKNLDEEFFLAQVALHKSKRPLDRQQVEAAGKRLHAFLDAMEDWERSAYKRSLEIKERYENTRTRPNEGSEEEARENKQFWSDINAQKAAIAQEFCSTKLLRQGAERANGFGSHPDFLQQEDWIEVDTPSRKKTLIYCKAQNAWDWHRYTLILEDGQWKLDAVHWRDGGWKRYVV